MSLHNNPKYQTAELIESLKLHRLNHDKPSQLADAFRTGWMAGRSELMSALPMFTANSLKWSEVREPNDVMRYNHIVAESLLGPITIEWENKKEHKSYYVYLGSQCINICSTLAEAQRAAREYFFIIPCLDNAKKDIHSAIGFNFESNELQTVNANDLLQVYAYGASDAESGKIIEYEATLDKLAQSNYELRKENEALKTAQTATTNFEI